MRSKLTHGSLFAGIGGFDLGFERAGFQTIWQVERDDFCLELLERYYPNVRRLRDIADAENANLETPTVITGGFPCQPVSIAGQRRAQADARWLWPTMCSIIAKLRPPFVVIENVPGLLSAGYDEVCADLESEAYAVGTLIIPACAFGYPHLRNRLWILAYTESMRMAGRGAAGCGGSARQSLSASVVPPGDWQTIADQLCRMDDGLSHRVYQGKERGKALGNAVVPQIAEEIAWMIRQTMKDTNDPPLR